MPWPCFLIHPTNRVAERLIKIGPSGCWRRSGGRHLATALIAHCTKTARVLAPVPRCQVKRTDPRWPVKCACGYRFGADDASQHGLERMYTGKGTTAPLRRFPPGAMVAVEAGHALTFRSNPGPDGCHLFVKLPGGLLWEVCGHRHGTPPWVTGASEIQVKGYTGWLTEGTLTDDRSGRAYTCTGDLRTPTAFV